MAYINFHWATDMRHLDLSEIAETPDGYWEDHGANPISLSWRVIKGSGLNSETFEAIQVLGTNFTFDGTSPSAHPLEADVTNLYYYDSFAGYSWSMGRASFHLSDLIKVSSTATLADDAAFMAKVLSGNDVVTGSSGNDVLNGYAGSDYLKGGDGSDHFVFSSKLVAEMYDSIADFDPVQDRIELDHHVFKKLSEGPLNPNAFWVGTAAHDADDRIIYAPQYGALFYDKDGTGKARPVPFANVGLDSSHAPDAHDFLII